MDHLRTANSHPLNGSRQTANHRNFRKAASLLALAVAAGMILQNIASSLGEDASRVPGIVLAILGIAGLTALSFSRSFRHTIDSPHFAITSLLGIALGTAVGTFVSQNIPIELFTQRYGETAGPVLKALWLHDVFHSWWYVGCFAILALSLLKISWKKKFTWEHLGFHLAHLGPVIILAGFWIDHFQGFRGIIQLEEGESSNTVKLYAGQTNFLTDSTTLDFRIRLDHFEFAKYEPDYRIQIWRRSDDKLAMPVSHGMMNESPPDIIASMAPEPMKIRHIYGTDIYFRMKELYPNFTFNYTYPLITDDIEAVDPGIQLELLTPHGEVALQLLANKPGRNKIVDVEMLGGWLECYWEIPHDVLEDLKNPPAPDQTGRVILCGKDRMVHFLRDGELKTDVLEKGRTYPLPGKGATGFRILHIFPDASLMQAVPSTKDDQLVNPVARVEIWRKGQPGQDVYIYPGGGRNGGTFQIPESPYFLAFESFRDMETKYYKSDLSVLNQEGEVKKEAIVVVNEPMQYDGYRFYQTDYNPDNPSYSGIGVTYNPGLPFVYFGFYALVAGVALMFYTRKKSS